MKRLLNTLYVTQNGAWVSHEGESIVVRVDNEIKLRVPICGLAGVICLGYVNCSSSFFGLCAKSGVAVSLLTAVGKFQARVTGYSTGNVLLRREQYGVVDNPERQLAIASNMVVGKIANQRAVLMRCSRDHSDKVDVLAIKRIASRLSSLIEQCGRVPNIDSLRGVEGEAAKIYFEGLNFCITNQKDDFFIRARSKRPPLDNLNALLSFLYTLLVHDAEAALEAHGLDRQVGFLHTERPGRPSLALDLMEEFRPFIADRIALSLINMKQLNPKGFERTESGAVIMNDETRKAVIVAYQKRKQEEIYHPFIEEKIAVGLVMYVQAQLLSRYLRGDLDGYPPFIWR